ncbi:MAG: hypothetical protein HY057_14405 [Rhodospirillales bacterium]|nr:hypothetical protein [Rhodospirillales bacterium]
MNMTHSVPLIVMFATAILLSRAYLATRAYDPMIGRLSRMLGRRCDRLLLGFIAFVAAISALLPNVVTAMAVAPLLPLFVARFAYPDAATERLVATAFTAGAMWAANIGGMASMIGSPANALLLVYLKAANIPGADRLNFFTWLIFGLPVAAVLCLFAWGVLRIGLHRALAAATPNGQAAEAAPAGGRETIDAASRAVYRLTIAYLLFWCAEGIVQILLPAPLKPWLIAASVGFGLWFVWALMGRKRETGQPLLRWRDATSRPPLRGMLLIGVTVAVSLTAVKLLHMDKSIATLAGMARDENLAPILILLVMLLITVFATEFISNTVVALTFFPIVQATAVTLGYSPLPMLIVVSLASTMPFMSPIGSPSNALLIGEARGIRLRTIFRLGFILDIAGAVVLALFGAYVLRAVL